MTTTPALNSWQTGAEHPRWNEVLRQDAAAERTLIEALSRRTRHDRARGPATHPCDVLIERSTGIDCVQDMAFDATVHPDGKDQFVAVSRYSASVDKTGCERGVTVMDDWRRKGLGIIVLKQVIDVARSRGIKTMWSLDSAENVAMSDLVHDPGFQRKHVGDNSSQVIDCPWLASCIRRDRHGCRQLIDHACHQSRVDFKHWRSHRILVAVDGSAVRTNLVKFAARLMRRLAEPARLMLCHAHPPVMNAVAIKVGPDAMKRYHDENGKFATKAARAVLKRAQVEFEKLLVVAEAAEAIAGFATKKRFDLIVMRSRGHAAPSSLFLGSVTSKVIAHCAIPVTVAH